MLIYFDNKCQSNFQSCRQMNVIRAVKFGTTVVTKHHHGFSRDRGVIDLGGPFWVPFWASKKVQ
jgi:hypothetical protein